MALGNVPIVTPASHASDRLLNPTRTPSSGLVCEYGSVFDQGPGPRHTLARQIVLPRASAMKLATAAALIRLRASTPRAICPNDDGRATVITFSYPHSPAVHLWWHAAGCQTIDDGEVQADQIANDSFGHFQTVFTELTRTTR